MTQRIASMALLVPDYAAGIAFYCDVLGFDLLEDTPVGGDKRWVRVAPLGGRGPALLLARAVGRRQKAAIGVQAGGRVFLFLETDDFWGDHARYTAAGVEFREAPRTERYGTVAVFADPFGNLWDLIAPS